MIAIAIHENLLIQFPITGLFLKLECNHYKYLYTNRLFFLLKYFPGHMLLRVS